MQGQAYLLDKVQAFLIVHTIQTVDLLFYHVSMIQNL